MATDSPSIPRYSERPLPPYRHVPGETPHPVRDPGGHSFGRELAPISIDEASWASNDSYRYAIDLFNAGYYWECHEALEPLWHGVGRDGAVGRFVQGLIQAAAALLKATTNKPQPARTLAAAAAAKLHAGDAVMLGVDAHGLADRVLAYTEGSEQELPQIVLREP
jgi:predicted metal-dependent hydrolase